MEEKNLKKARQSPTHWEKCGESHMIFFAFIGGHPQPRPINDGEGQPTKAERHCTAQVLASVR